MTPNQVEKIQRNQLRRQKKKAKLKAYEAFVNCKKSNNAHAKMSFKSELSKLGDKEEQKRLQKYFELKYLLKYKPTYDPVLVSMVRRSSPEKLAMSLLSV